MKVRFTKEELQQAINISCSFSETARNLNLSTNSPRYEVIKKYIALYELDISHFTYKGVRRNKNTKSDITYLLTENSTYSRQFVKNKLLKLGMKEERCEICGQGNEWNGQHLIMILDHINGIYNDNRLENLRMVCPNCNYQLPTTSGRKNKKSYPNCYCGKEISRANVKYCSQKCRIESPAYEAKAFRQRKVERPSYEQLLSDIEQMSMVTIGRKYQVSDNAVRNWLKQYRKQI